MKKISLFLNEHETVFCLRALLLEEKHTLTNWYQIQDYPIYLESIQSLRSLISDSSVDDGVRKVTLDNSQVSLLSRSLSYNIDSSENLSFIVPSLLNQIISRLTEEEYV